MLIRRNHTLKIYRKLTLSKEIEKSYRLLVAVIFILNVGLYSLFLYIGSFYNSQGYILKKLQLENNELYYQSKLLDIKIVEAKTFSRIEKNQRAKDMAKAQNPIYYKPDSIAIREIIKRY